MIQWYSRTPARPPTTNAMILVITAVISKVATVLRVVGVTSVIEVGSLIPNEILAMVLIANLLCTQWLREIATSAL